MRIELDLLLRRYETGEISRRQLLGALAALYVPLPLARESAPPEIGAAKQLNHVGALNDHARFIRTFSACPY